MTKIRMITKGDISDIKQVLDTIELFPSEMLDDMISDYLNNPETEEIWFTETKNGKPISLGSCAPEQLTEGTYNLYAIGVRSDIQSKGIGSRMMTFIENHLKTNGHRILIVDTSGTDDFKLTRKFYEKLGYKNEAVIRDFWKDGDDKVTYWKKLKYKIGLLGLSGEKHIYTLFINCIIRSFLHGVIFGRNRSSQINQGEIHYTRNKQKAQP